jgi:hypothetical protein
MLPFVMHIECLISFFWVKVDSGGLWGVIGGWEFLEMLRIEVRVRERVRVEAIFFIFWIGFNMNYTDLSGVFKLGEDFGLKMTAYFGGVRDVEN